MNGPSQQQLLDAFQSIETHDLKVNVVGCSVCGCLVKLDDENSMPCEHLIELFHDIREMYKDDFLKLGVRENLNVRIVNVEKT